MNITTNIKVLIVDDLETARRTLRLTLKNINYTVTEEAESGEDALKKLCGDSRFRLILLDWNMPKMSGMEFFRELRKKAEWNHVKVIMITAETLQENVITAIQAGVDQYIIKPVMPKTLEGKIVNVMEKEVREIKSRLVQRETLLTRSSSDEGQLKLQVTELYHDALEEFKAACELYPWKASPHYEIAMLYLRMGHLLEAKKKLETALEVDPRHQESCIELGKLFMKRKQPEKAIKVLSGLSALNPSSLLFQELGECYLLLGETNKAIKAFNDSIAYAEKGRSITKRQLAEKHEGLGNAFAQKFRETQEGSWQKKSIDSFEKSNQFDPTYISAHFNLIHAYKQSGQMEKAEALIKTAAEITPNDTEGWLSLGRIFLDNDEASKAAFAFKRAVEVSNIKGQTYFEVGDIYEPIDLGLASKYVIRANATTPGQAYILNKLGMLNRKRGNVADSIRFYEKAVEADPKDEKIYCNLAFASLKSGLPDAQEKARYNLEKALEIDPDFKEAADMLKGLSEAS